MQARSGLILTAILLSSVAAGSASAHGKHPPRDLVDRGYGHVHWRAPARSAHMPRWLRHDRQFLRWYRQSALRHDPYLPWWKVYRVYERHYALRYPYHDSRDWRYDRDRGHHRDRYDDREDRHDDRPRRRDRR